MAINLSGMFQNLGSATEGLSKSIMGSPVPTDPTQQNAMQRAGVTNPMLQMLGQGLGTSMGRDMRSPAEQVKALMGQLDPNDPTAVLKIAAALKDIDPAKSAQLIAEYRAAQTKAGQEQYSFSGNERFKDAAGNYYWGVQSRSSKEGRPKMMLLDLNNQEVDPNKIEGLQRVNADGLTAQELAKIEREKGFSSFDAQYYADMMKNIANADTKDAALRRMEEVLSNPEFDLNLLDNYMPDLLKDDLRREYEGIRGELGLSIVGATTFGALSKGELDLALAVAMPQFSNNADALDWVRRKRAADAKLKNEVLYAARLLRQGKSADEVASIMQERTSTVDTLEGTGTGLNKKTYTTEQWEATKKKHNLDDKQLKELLKNKGIEASVGAGV